MKTTKKKKGKEVQVQNKKNKNVIRYCNCTSANGCGFEPGLEGRLICSACGGYAMFT
jgi:hypothetical protein